MRTGKEPGRGEGESGQVMRLPLMCQRVHTTPYAFTGLWKERIEREQEGRGTMDIMVLSYILAAWPSDCNVTLLYINLKKKGNATYVQI